MADGVVSDFKVQHVGKTYNIQNFLSKHPGGFYDSVDNFENKDVTEKMKRTHHSQSAFYLLREYKEGGRDEDVFQENEDMEKLVDWNKPMISQIPKLGTKYPEWVRSPVDRKLILFGNPFIEFLTHTSWYVIPIYWIPVIIYFIFDGISTYKTFTNGDNIEFVVIGCLISGLILWTFLEYLLHRFVFHIEPTGKSKAVAIFHFTIHGLHHKCPFDATRLVFPPVAATVITIILYNSAAIFIPRSVMKLVIAGVIAGYLSYDMIHYYIHYGHPTDGSYLYKLKRYHNQHHFAHHNDGFGITNLFWDHLFGTAIHLRKLATSLKWYNNHTKGT